MKHELPKRITQAVLLTKETEEKLFMLKMFEDLGKEKLKELHKELHKIESKEQLKEKTDSQENQYKEFTRIKLICGKCGHETGYNIENDNKPIIPKQPEVKLPKKMKFKINNIPYFQDMSFFKGIPEGIEFEIDKSSSGDSSSIWLTANGFGKKGNYGNGSIAVKKEYLYNYFK